MLITDMEQTRILCSKCSLHINGGTLAIAEHKNRRPFRDSYARCQLADRKRNCLVVVRNSIFYPVKCFCIASCIVLTRIDFFTVTGSEHNFVFLKNRVIAKFYLQTLGRIHTVQEPEGMFEFVTKFRGRERELLVGGQSIQELVYRFLVYELIILNSEKLVQIKCPRTLVAVDINTFSKFILYDIGHPISEHIQLRQI